MSEGSDIVFFNGEEFSIQSGLSEADVRESMAHVFPAARHAKLEKVVSDSGQVTWMFTERGGDKG